MPPYEELSARQMGFTKPDEAAEFVKRTDVDWRSVSIGSFHGAISLATKDQSKMPAKLDIERLNELCAATGIPLVLHGGSGVIQSYVDKAITSGSVQDAQAAVIEAIRGLVCDVYHICGPVPEPMMTGAG